MMMKQGGSPRFAAQTAEDIREISARAPVTTLNGKMCMLRILAALLCIAVLALPAQGRAKEDGIDISNPAASGANWKYDGEIVTIEEDGTYRITGSSTTNSIDIRDDITVTLILQNASILLPKEADYSRPALRLFDGSKVTLIVEGTNKLRGEAGQAGIQTTNAELSIQGEGILNVWGGDGVEFESYNGGGAGIGGSSIQNYPQMGNGGKLIIFPGVTVNAHGGKGGVDTTVTPGNETLFAYGGGAGIGGAGGVTSNGGDGGTIIIHPGATVNAYGGSGTELFFDVDHPVASGGGAGMGGGGGGCKSGNKFVGGQLKESSIFLPESNDGISAKGGARGVARDPIAGVFCMSGDGAPFGNGGDGSLNKNYTDGHELIDANIKRVVVMPLIDASGDTLRAYEVTLSCTTAGATIHYTSDGADPTQSSTEYTGPFTVSSSCTMKARAFKSGMQDSATAAEAFNIVPRVDTPTIAPHGGTFIGARQVTLACTTEDAAIYYTLDHSEPTTSDGILYSSPFIVSTSCTIKAKAFKEGMSESKRMAAAFTIKSVPTSYTTSGGVLNFEYAGKQYTGAWENGVLVVQGAYEKCTGVWVDGIPLQAGLQYDLTQGSTIINFTSAYLATLKNGTHTIRVQFTDGKYEGTFTTPFGIVTTSALDVPATGGMPAWIPAAGLLGLCGAVRVLRRRRV